MLYAGVWALALAIFMRLESGPLHVTGSVRSVNLGVHKQKLRTRKKNNQLASGNTRASKACSLTARAVRTSWPSPGISIIAEAQPSDER